MLKVHNFVNALVTALEKREERNKKNSHINKRKKMKD